jgi:DNA repair exonuclease SbcCD ATPase subunit
LGARCPVCDQDYDREATERRLRGILGNHGARGSSPAAPEILPELLNALASIEKDLSSAQLALRGEEQKAKEVQLLEESIARRLKEVALDANAGTDRTAVVQDAISTAHGLIRSSAEQRRTGEVLALQLTQASDQARLDELRNEIALLAGSVDEQDGRVKERTVTGDLGQRIVEALREATSTVVTRRLEELAPLLQGVYSRIDPHPAFRVVSFLSEVVRGRGRLFTVISDPQSSAQSNAPNTVLSSSQMNALAVSVFLSLNLGISRPPLYSAILDDPLQSLDDINLLGLVDLLRRTKDQRQLLVSTHNERFGALLARKLRPTGPDRRTVLIELKGWAREGPVVKHRDVKSDPSPIRLAAS